MDEEKLTGSDNFGGDKIKSQGVLFNRVKEFIQNLRDLPEDKRKKILFAIVIIVGVIIGLLNLISTKKNISKIEQSIESINLAQIGILDHELQGNVQEDINSELGHKLTEDSLNDINVENENAGQNTEVPELNLYENKKYDFSFYYPADWIPDLKQNTDLEVWIEKKDVSEIAHFHIEVVSETQNIKTALDGINLSISQIKNVIKPKKEIIIGNYRGYEVIGTVCTKICNGSADDVYSPFSIIYFLYNDTVIKIKYSEGMLGVGWKNTTEEWKSYDEYKNIISTFKFNEI